MYKLVYSSPTLRQNDIRQLFTNILVKTGNRVLNIVNYGLNTKPNIINFIRVKNLLPTVLYTEPNTLRQCCLHINTKDLFNTLYSQFIAFADTSAPQNTNYCTASNCSTPQNLMVVFKTNTTATIGWTLDFGQTYNIYLDDTLIGTNVTSPYTILNLVTDTTYTVTIKSGDKDTCQADLTFSTTNTTCVAPVLTVEYTDPQPGGPTGNLTLIWTLSTITNTVSQTAKKRSAEDVSWITTGFTPANPLTPSAVTTVVDVEFNEVYQFQVDNNCTIGGPTGSNIVEGVVFNCPSTSTITTDTTSSTTAGDGVFLPQDIFQVRFTLKLTADDSTVYGPIIVPTTGGQATTGTTGLTPGTDYYWVYELYAVINGITVISSAAPYSLTCTEPITTTEV